MASPMQAREERSLFGLLTISIALGVFFLATAAFVVSTIKSPESGGSGGSSSASASAPISVTISEFKITPEAISAPAGKVTLSIKNTGSMAHNFEIAELGKKTADIAPGASATLDLGELKEGTYAVICNIAGHADSGMKGTLVVGGAAASTDTAMDHSSAEMTADEYAAMQEKMLASFTGFPATTEGHGNQKIEPTIGSDGVKEFNLTAKIVDWEVEPGKFVKAWTYNGMVPGPWIKVNVGDTIRIKLKNDLPIGTDIHWHGIDTPFAMDGVAPITQKLIDPGTTFTYEFVVPRQELGMYHAHFDGVNQVVNGMFAAVQVGDMPLPTGRTVSGTALPKNITVSQEMPMVVNDAGVIGLTINGKGFPATEPIVTKKDDWILVHYFNEGLLSHPMHLHKFRQLIVAKDGIPLDQPYYADTINVAPGERYSVLVQTSEVGTWVWHCHILNHVERADGMFGMVTAIVVKE